MSAPSKREYLLRAAAGYLLVCGLAGALASLVIAGLGAGAGIAVGLFAGVLMATAELSLFTTRGKRMRFLPHLLLRTAVDLAAVVAAAVVAGLFGVVLPEGGLAALTGWGAFALLFANFVRLVNRALGQRSLPDLLAGRYHHPVEEERVFMALDLRSSPQIAAALGQRRYHEFLDDFFFDITPAIVESRGEIYQYAGDEVIVTWPRRGQSAPADSLYCYFRIAAIVGRTSADYERRYGFIPEFKTGLHYGPVVAGYLGDVKRDIVFHGETVGTASRIKGECATVGKNLLFSSDLLKNVQLSSSLTPERIGRIRMKGKEREKDKEIELYTLAEAA